MARMLGVRANAVIAGAFAMSGMLAGIVSMLVISRVGALDPRLGVNMALYGFVSTVVGGMGSLTGPVAGGFLVGIASGVIQAILPEGLRPTRDAFVRAAAFSRTKSAWERRSRPVWLSPKAEQRVPSVSC